MLETLEKYYQDGLLTKQTHPTLDLTIWNYTPDVQVNKLWDDITLQCRGLVTDSLGNIVARPFKKFFNYGELNPEDIPNTSFQIFEKMDGSLGILFYYKGEIVFASRGSFTSEQAIIGRQILENYRMTLMGDKDIYQAIGGRDINEYTLMCEIIYPENRIVVDYGYKEEVVLLAMINKRDATELSYRSLIDVGDILSMPVVKRYDGITDYTTIKDTITDDEEGRVVLFKNGLRMKIKGDEYLRLHSILTKISTRDIWEWAKEGKTIDEMLVDVPDEFYGWAKATYNGLLFKFDVIREELEKDFWSLIDRKAYAEKIKDKSNKHLLFKRLTSHSHQLNDMIWNMIYPDYYKPFSNKTIEDDN